jgi:hypothetical protein
VPVSRRRPGVRVCSPSRTDHGRQPLVGTDPDVSYVRTRYCLLTDEHKQLVADLTRICRFRAISDGHAGPHERHALAAYLREESEVRRVGRYRWEVAGREVDLEWARRTATARTAGTDRRGRTTAGWRPTMGSASSSPTTAPAPARRRHPATAAVGDGAHVHDRRRGVDEVQRDLTSEYATAGPRDLPADHHLGKDVP